PLIGSSSAEDDFVGVQTVVGGVRNAIGESRPDAKQNKDHERSDPQRSRAADLFAEQIGRPQRDTSVEEILAIYKSAF
ncbi:MAG: hypothetical protein Q8909_18615, partial [Bacteroidota bacterium]|nr:hypothetical protein [Bacteroidota bacterium]